MRPRNVLGVLGLILRPFALVLLVPAAVDLYYGRTDAAAVFVATAGAAFMLGLVLRRMRAATEDLVRIEAMAVVASSWLLAALFGAVPYMQQGLAPIDALFESMSGFTTTGSTVFMSEDFIRLSRGLIFWRSMTQWLGGLGIIVLFVAVLPALAVAGRRMFFAEAPGPEEETLTPRIRHTAAALWRLYIALTGLEAMLLVSVGDMSLSRGTAPPRSGSCCRSCSWPARALPCSTVRSRARRCSRETPSSARMSASSSLPVSPSRC
jgi:trk system potassium uptake protein TrkH